jgi:hypothetical protein
VCSLLWPGVHVTILKYFRQKIGQKRSKSTTRDVVRHIKKRVDFCVSCRWPCRMVKIEDRNIEVRLTYLVTLVQ